MTYRQEFDRLREAFKKREQRRQNVEIATVQDTSMHEAFGYVMATLVDGTPVNVQAWTNTALTQGSMIIIQPLSGHSWNWYVLLGVNNSTNLESVPFTPPTQSTLPSHTLDSHTGTLPYSRLSGVTLDLDGSVSGTLPTSAQEKQTSRQSLVITTSSIGAGATVTGSTAGYKVAWVRKMTVTGTASYSIRFLESSGGTIEYECSNTAVPFTDGGGWMHAASDSNFYWSVTNGGGTSSVCTITLDLIVWEV